MSWRMRMLYLGARVYWALFQPLTIGVKLLLIREDEVLLVRHTYREGWFLPGGGVKKKEFFVTAAHREAAEEVGAAIHDMSLFGVYSNIEGWQNDHIVTFLSHDFDLGEADRIEIADISFFPLTALPEGISPACARRVREYREGREGERPFMRTW